MYFKQESPMGNRKRHTGRSITCSGESYPGRGEIPQSWLGVPHRWMHPAPVTGGTPMGPVVRSIMGRRWGTHRV